MRCHLEFNVPETKCLYRISKKHPNLAFKNISMLPLPDDMGNTLVEVASVGVKNLIEDLKKERNIIDHSIVLETQDHTLVNIKVEDPMVLKLLTKHHVIIDYPLMVQDGIAQVNLIGERKDIDGILTDLEKKRVNFKIISLGAQEDPHEILTGKQKDVLVKSLEKGFFEIPRKISLTDLAKEFDVSPAALSEMLRRLSKRLAEHYMFS